MVEFQRFWLSSETLKERKKERREKERGREREREAEKKDKKGQKEFIRSQFLIAIMSKFGRSIDAIFLDVSSSFFFRGSTEPDNRL